GAGGVRRGRVGGDRGARVALGAARRAEGRRHQGGQFQAGAVARGREGGQHLLAHDAGQGAPFAVGGGARQRRVVDDHVVGGVGQFLGDLKANQVRFLGGRHRRGARFAEGDPTPPPARRSSGARGA